MQVDQNECRHKGCNCLAESGQQYCSSYCEQAAATEQPPGATCRCGHPECNVPPGVPESAVGGG